MSKVVGALLLVMGGGYLCAERIVRRRKEIQLLYELAIALESIEGMIRWEKVVLPVALERQCSRENCGKIFSYILDLVKGELTLQDAWNKAFSRIAIAGDILCRMEFSGDETRITGQLHMAAQQMRQRAEQQSAGRGESEKLSVAVCVSSVGLLAILLF